MTLLYCSADGAGPRPCPDWRALASAAQATDAAATTDPDAPVTSAVDALNAQRIAEPGHVARNGNPPRTAAREVPETFDLVGPEDAFGGCFTAPALLCPECGAPVRCVVS